MKILLTASSRHGATDEVAAVIAEQLRAAGLEVDHTRPEDVADVEGYDAFVLGSAVYMTRWTEEAVDFTRRFSSALRDQGQDRRSLPHRPGPAIDRSGGSHHVPGAFRPRRAECARTHHRPHGRRHRGRFPRSRGRARVGRLGGGHPVQWFVRREWRCRDSVSIGLSAYRPIGLSVCRRDRCPGSAPGSSSGSAGTYSIGLPSAAGSLCEASSAPSPCRQRRVSEATE